MKTNTANSTQHSDAIHHMSSERVNLPLSSLVLSPHNIRKTQRTNLEELAAILLSQGVLENLIVHRVKKSGGRATPKHAVAAGGRRLAALELLASRKQIAADYPVPCLLVNEDRAIEVSVAENSHEPMHPADEFDAFKAMSDKGKSIEDIAAAFGVTPLTVKRRLRLANVSPRLLSLYREGEANLEQLMTLAITEDQKAQELAWDSLPSYGRHVFALRRCLTEQEVDACDHPLAQWVGIEAYEAAGGRVRRDLFSEDDGGYLMDIPLLESLALAKLEQAAEAVRGEEWAWVDVRTSCDYTALNKFSRSPKKKRDPTGDEQTLLDELMMAREAAEVKINEYANVGEFDEDVADEMEQRLWVINDDIEALMDGLEEYSTEGLTCGAIVTLNSQGELVIQRGLIRPEDKPASSSKVAGTGIDQGTAGIGATKAVHAESLVRMLSAQRTAALQASLASRPDVALAAVVGAMASQVFSDVRYSILPPLQVSLKETELNRDCHDIEQSRARIALDAQHNAWIGRFPQDNEESFFAWLLNQSQETLLELLAFCAACSVNAVQSREFKVGGVVALSEALALDMANWWKATPSTYLSHVNKQRLVDVVTEAVSEDAAKPLATMKKSDAVVAAASHLDGLRWLPEPLR